MMKTITRADVAEILYQEVGLSRKDSGEILDMVLEEIVNELAAGSDVKLSSFGTFALRDKKPRIGRNPNRCRSGNFFAPGHFLQTLANNAQSRQQEINMVVNKSKAAFRTIAEVAEELGVGTHVLRFWETKFSQLKPMKRNGGRRYYRPDDVELLKCIKNLLYVKRLTIEGAQKEIRSTGVKALIGETIQDDFFAAETDERSVLDKTVAELHEIRDELQEALGK